MTHTFDDGVCGQLLDEAALLVCVEVKVEGVNGGDEGKKEREEEPHFEVKSQVHCEAAECCRVIWLGGRCQTHCLHTATLCHCQIAQHALKAV